MNNVLISFAQVVPTRVTASSVTLQVKPADSTALPDGTARKTFLATLDLDRVDILEAFCSRHNIPCAVSRDQFGEQGRWVEARDAAEAKGEVLKWADYAQDRKLFLMDLVVGSHTDAIDREGNPTPDGKLYATRPDGTMEEVFEMLLPIPQLA